MLSRTLGEDIEIETSLDPDVGGVIADPQQLENALLNLAVNARDAMPGGGRIVVSTFRIDIEQGDAIGLDDIAPGQYGVLAVTDTGRGMDPETAARAFEPFFTTKDVGKGTGLGLSMVYGFARQSGGQASLYSEPGVGTTVRIYLPRSEAGGRTAVESAPTAPDHLAQGDRILLVEDDRDVRELVARQLVGLGYAVHAVENGPGALAHLDTGTVVDLMLTDIVMPGGMSGTDFADAARARRPGLRVVYMSGYAEGNSTLDRPGAGPSLFIAKPFTKAQLSDVVRRALVAAGPSEEAAGTA